MNRTLIVAFLRQRVLSPVRMVLFLLTFGFPLLLVAFLPGAALTFLGNNTANFALILGAGMIGQDHSAGVLQLLFARPVTRSEYVLSRWLAAAGSAAAVVLAQVALGWALTSLRGQDLGVREVALFAGENALLAVGVASVLALFSALMPSIADLALYLMVSILGGIFQLLAQALRPAALYSRVGDEIGRFLSPRIDLTAAFGGHAIPWFSIASYFSTVTLCLALAIVVVNRKELSYASG